eukprot:g1033.t1
MMKKKPERSPPKWKGPVGWNLSRIGKRIGFKYAKDPNVVDEEDEEDDKSAELNPFAGTGNLLANAMTPKSSEVKFSLNSLVDPPKPNALNFLTDKEESDSTRDSSLNVPFSTSPEHDSKKNIQTIPAWISRYDNGNAENRFFEVRKHFLSFFSELKGMSLPSNNSSNAMRGTPPSIPKQNETSGSGTEKPDVHAFIRSGEALLEDIDEISMECKEINRLDVLEAYVRIYHVELGRVLSFLLSEEGVESTNLDDLKSLIDFVSKYDRSVRKAVTGTDIAERFTVDNYAGDIGYLIAAYCKRAKDGMAKVLVRVVLRLRDEEVRLNPGFYVIGEGSDYEYLISTGPLDAFKTIIESLKWADEAKVEQLSVEMLKVCVVCVADFARLLSSGLHETLECELKYLPGTVGAVAEKGRDIDLRYFVAQANNIMMCKDKINVVIDSHSDLENKFELNFASQLSELDESARLALHCIADVIFHRVQLDIDTCSSFFDRPLRPDPLQRCFLRTEVMLNRLMPMLCDNARPQLLSICAEHMAVLYIRSLKHAVEEGAGFTGIFRRSFIFTKEEICSPPPRPGSERDLWWWACCFDAENQLTAAFAAQDESVDQFYLDLSVFMDCINPALDAIAGETGIVTLKQRFEDWLSNQMFFNPQRRTVIMAAFFVELEAARERWDAQWAHGAASGNITRSVKQDCRRIRNFFRTLTVRHVVVGVGALQRQGGAVGGVGTSGRNADSFKRFVAPSLRIFDDLFLNLVCSPRLLVIKFTALLNRHARCPSGTFALFQLCLGVRPDLSSTEKTELNSRVLQISQRKLMEEKIFCHEVSWKSLKRFLDPLYQALMSGELGTRKHTMSPKAGERKRVWSRATATEGYSYDFLKEIQILPLQAEGGFEI